jgi:hypothetical protein
VGSGGGRGGGGFGRGGGGSGRPVGGPGIETGGSSPGGRSPLEEVVEGKESVDDIEDCRRSCGDSVESDDISSSLEEESSVMFVSRGSQNLSPADVRFVGL